LIDFYTNAMLMKTALCSDFNWYVRRKGPTALSQHEDLIQLSRRRKQI